MAKFHTRFVIALRFQLLLIIPALLVCSCGARPQAKYPTHAGNAALRYWAAFTEMSDPLRDTSTLKLLKEMLAGKTDWNEKALGSILDANTEAIQTMQQGTRLPECDWGFEYDRGATPPPVLFLRARTLAELNALQGIRLMAKGDSQAAVNAWLAGIRFSQDLGRGGPLIFVLVANRMLLPDLHALNVAVRKGQLNEMQKKEVFGIVKILPVDGLDWVGAWEREYAQGVEVLQELRTSTNPKAIYEKVGMPVPGKGIPPTIQEIQEYREYMFAVQMALRESPAKANAALHDLEAKRLHLGEVEQNLIPSAEGVNRARAEAVAELAELMQALSTR